MINVVELDSVTRRYGSVEALRGVSLRLGEGERIVILGPSGCGKTTILRLIAGFEAPDGGSIRIGGETVSVDGRVIVPPERRGIGMVFQDLALWPHLSVEGNIEFGLKARGMGRRERKERIRSVLSLVHMEDYAGRKPAQLSGGQRQRVALARVLALEPEIVLMDEPLSSLDYDLNKRLRGEILELQERIGFTLLYVTHDREEALEIATRIVFMRKGEVEREAAVEEARRNGEWSR